MKNQIKKSLVALIAIAAFSPIVSAVPIAGTINLTMAPGATMTLLNNVGTPGPVTAINADAVQFTNASAGFYSGHNAMVSLSSGSFATATPGAIADFANFTFNPVTVPVSNLWTVAGLFRFELTAINVVDQSTPNFLNIQGGGYYDDLVNDAGQGNAGFQRTYGLWTFTVTGQNPNFSWTSYNTVPDSGMTAVLLGASLLGLGLIRRFGFAKK